MTSVRSKQAIERIGAARIAAFVFEPVIGSGGVLVAPPGYLDGVQRLCRRHGILTIADVVIGGFGRLGDWLAVERFGLEPDLIVFAKGVTSGTLPLGGVIVAPGIAAPFWSTPGGPTFDHGQTAIRGDVGCVYLNRIALAEGAVSRPPAEEMGHDERAWSAHADHDDGEDRNHDDERASADSPQIERRGLLRHAGGIVTAATMFEQVAKGEGRNRLTIGIRRFPCAYRRERISVWSPTRPTALAVTCTRPGCPCRPGQSGAPGR